MRETGNTFGNCLEGTSIAASYLTEKMPGVTMTVAESAGADHVFLMVGDVGQSAGRSIKRWDELCNFRGQSYVIDVWAGICCHTDDYPAQLAAKMQKWQEKGKRIVVDGNLEEKELKLAEPVRWVGKLLDAGVKYSRLNPEVNGTLRPGMLHTLARKRNNAIHTATAARDLALSKLQTTRREQARAQTQIATFLTRAQEASSDLLEGNIGYMSRPGLSARALEHSGMIVEGLRRRLDLIQNHREEFLRLELPAEMKADLQRATTNVSEAADKLRLHTRELYYLQMQEQRRRPPVSVPQASMATSSQLAPQPIQGAGSSARQRATESTQDNSGHASVRR